MSFWDELDNAHYESEQLFYESRPVADGFDVKVYVENETDSVFWNDIFGKYAPDLRLKFEYNERGDFKRGKTEILKSRRKTGKSFIICADSDFDQFMDKRTPFAEALNENPFIFQTYAYTVENFKCIPENLNRLCGTISLHTTPDDFFDFRIFLKELSKLFYKLLVYTIYFKRTSQIPPMLQRSRLAHLMNIPASGKAQVQDNGKFVLKKFAEKVEQIESKLLEKYPDLDLSELKDELKQSHGLTPENTFLYLNGHTLYDNMEKLLKRVLRHITTSKLKSFQHKAENSREPNVHLQAQNIEAQYKNRTGRGIYVQQIRQGKSRRKELLSIRIETLLSENHKNCLIYDNCDLLHKIEADIQHFLKLRSRN